jgi:hypothetical protein
MDGLEPGKAFPHKQSVCPGTAIAASFASAHSLGGDMQKLQQWRRKQEGKLGYILLWALGVPIPVLFVIFLMRGCT